MNEPLLAAVDIGTTNLKVGLFTLTGQCRGTAQRVCSPQYLPDGRIQLEADVWWQAFSDSFEECLSGVDRSQVKAIGISSQAQTHVWIDSEGKAVTPAISWLDHGGDPAQVGEDLAGFNFYQHVGFASPSPAQALTKLKGRIGCPPEAVLSRHRLLFADGYLIHALTGSCAHSRNLAAMGGLYSMVLNDWWPEALASAKLPPEVLPCITDVGQVAGRLRHDLAQRWGVAGVPVVAGANDQTVAALGAGATQPGDASLGMGTAIVAYEVIPSDAPLATHRSIRGPYLGSYHYQLQVCATGGAVIDWARTQLLDQAPWDVFFRKVLEQPLGCEGLRFLPEVGRGGAATGQFWGLTPGHTRLHMGRAVLEGVACRIRTQFERMRQGGHVRVTGGGSQNTGWMQLLADITGRSLERLDQSQAGLWGTAIAAAHGAGLASDMLALAAQTRGSGVVFRPRTEMTARYQPPYRDIIEA